MNRIIKLLLILPVLFVLTACGSSWDTEVDLTAEERAAIEEQIVAAEARIEKEVTDRVSGFAEAESYARLANAYIELGEMKKAEKVYKKAIATGFFASPLHNNLGRLYELVGEYDLAIEQYQILIDAFGENFYSYDITWAYIRSGRWREADKAFNVWQRTFNKTDENTQQAIKKLREAEESKEGGEVS